MKSCSHELLQNGARTVSTISKINANGHNKHVRLCMLVLDVLGRCNNIAKCSSVFVWSQHSSSNCPVQMMPICWRLFRWCKRVIDQARGKDCQFGVLLFSQPDKLQNAVSRPIGRSLLANFVTEKNDDRGVAGFQPGVNQLLPRLVEALRGVKVAMVAAGSYHSLVVAEGSAYSFGDGVMGQLGHGDRHEHLVPKRITALERVRSAVGGEKHSIALDDSGAPSRLVGCNPVYLGCNPLSPGCNPLPLGCSPLSPGCNPLSAGALFAFGAGKDGRLGVGHDVRPCSRCNAGPGLAHSPMACADGRQAPLHVPPQVGHGVLEELLLPRRIASLRGVRVISIAAGTEHSLVLADGGVVYSFGAGGGGKLGHGDARFQWIPTRVRALPPGARVVAIAAGDAHSLCALADGRVFGWGSGGLGMGLQPAEDPTTTVDHPPTDQQQLDTPGLADVALADIAIGSAGNQYIPAASVGSRRTLLPLALERCAVAPDAPGLSQLTTPWPAWPQEPVRNAHSSQRQRVRGCA